jgi:hypothetical protein
MKNIHFILFVLCISMAMSLWGCSTHNSNNGEKDGLGLHQNTKGAQDGGKDSTERDGTDAAQNDSTIKGGKVK